jgi:molybdopterin/thiamine biosynthesis adenylyltransferase
MIKDTFDRKSQKPINISSKKILDFLKRKPNICVINRVEDQLEEIFLLRRPKYRFDKNYSSELKSFLKKNQKYIDIGIWFYFPWLQTVINYLPEAMHIELKTGRNRNLITLEEQKKYYDSCIGIAGMSVGSHVALTIALTGGAKHIKLADLDVISGSNLNRIRSGFQVVGLSKVVAVARQIYEINPYSIVEVFEDGITDKNIKKFIIGNRKLDVLVEEMDNPYFKIFIRQIARTNSVPVIMAADNGDGIIADVERYDLDKNYPILHGIIKDLSTDKFKDISPTELPGVIAKMAGADMAVPRMLASVVEVGKTLYSWPQLGTAATMCGSVLAYLARKVVLKDKKIKSGRHPFGPEKIFESD